MAKTVHCCKGFTLIELLVVMTIVSILTAFAVPEYQHYKKRGFDLRAEFDLRNVAIAEEAYFMDHEEYYPCTNAECTELPGIAKLSDGVTLNITTTDTSFQGSSSHPQGTGKTFHYDSEQGGFL